MLQIIKVLASSCFCFRNFQFVKVNYRQEQPVIIEELLFGKTGFKIKIRHLGHDIDSHRLTPKPKNIYLVRLQKPVQGHVEDGHLELIESIFQKCIILRCTVDP